MKELHALHVTYAAVHVTCMFVPSLIWHICVIIIGSIFRYFDVHVGSLSSTDYSGI